MIGGNRFFIHLTEVEMDDLADRFGVSPAYIQRFLRKVGIDPRKNGALNCFHLPV